MSYFTPRALDFMRWENEDRTNLNESKTMRQVKYLMHVQPAAKGEFAAFMNKALKDKLDERRFKERLFEFNDQQVHARCVKYLSDRHGVTCATDFVKNFSEEFVEFYCKNAINDPSVAIDQLALVGGTDWTDLKGYSYYGAKLFMGFVQDAAGLKPESRPQKKSRVEDAPAAP